MSGQQRKPYINGWRSYEIAYAKLLFMAGFGVYETTDKINSVNILLKMPIRSDETIKMMARGYRRQYQRQRMREIAFAKKSATAEKVADRFGCTEPYVRYCAKRLREGKL